MSNYEIYDATMTIKFTNKAFLNRAKCVGSPEFREVITLRNDHPGYSFKEDFRKGNKNFSRPYSYDEMRAIIRENMGDDAEKMCAEIDKMRKTYAISSDCYGKIRDWFFTQFPELKAAYDEAKEEDRIIRAKRKAIKEGMVYEG